jgi:hypothetical protein
MRNVRFAGIMAVLLITLVVTASAADIRGTYLESRNAEVYASHCFANSEIGLRGNLAVMAWKIEEGAWNGVSLDDLGVVAVVKANATLGDPFNNPLLAKAALIVDERASAEQREALAAFAKHMGGGLLDNVVRTDAAPISVQFDGGIHARKATLTAGDLVSLKTRPIQQTDSLCHLDDVYYNPLVKLDHAMAAFALESHYSGNALDVTFSSHNRSSAYLRAFSVGASGYTD